MALFKNEKKLTLDEILKGVKDLPEEDRAKVKAKMEDLYKAEDEREIDKIEEEKADEADVENEKKEEKNDESEEIGKDVDEVEDEIEEDEESTQKDPDSDLKVWKKSIEDEILKLKEAIKGYAREPKETDKTASERLNALARKFE